MSISFHGIGQICATFLGSNIREGHMVRMNGNSTVSACAEGEDFFGVACCCSEDACSVQVAGFVSVGYSGDPPSTGWATLCANGEGGVTESGNGREVLVVDTNTTDRTVTIRL